MKAQGEKAITDRLPKHKYDLSLFVINTEWL